MLPWIFVVLLALNLALFLWGYRNEHLREPPLPPVPQGQHEIRLLSEVQAERPTPTTIPPPRGTVEAPIAPTPSGNAGTTPAETSDEESAPAADLVEPARVDDDAWVERELTGESEPENATEAGSPTDPGATPATEPADTAGEADTDPTPSAEPSGPEMETRAPADPIAEPPTEPATQPASDELEHRPFRELRPEPEIPKQQPRTPGGVSAHIESTA